MSKMTLIYMDKLVKNLATLATNMSGVSLKKSIHVFVLKICLVMFVRDTCQWLQLLTNVDL